MTTSEQRMLLRHTLATVAYRGGKAVRNAPEGFPEFKIGDTGRTPAQILAHMGDLYDWALSLVQGKHLWHNSQPLPWDKEIDRFFAALKALDDYLADHEVLSTSAEKLFQGPIADSLTHVGQLTMMRRLASAPIRGENYYKANIITGQVGPDQDFPKVEFD